MPAAKSTNMAEFRFFAELSDFLPPSQRGDWLGYHFRDFPGIKDPIEALGVPHTEVELIIVNGSSVDFSYQLRHGDRVAVYPRFFQVNVGSLTRLREPPPRVAFVLDVHLGKLAKLLRLLGIDVIYRNDFNDFELAHIAEREARILLTRDRRLLFHRRIVHGRFVRNTNSTEQAKEIITSYGLESYIRPFTRCMICNGQVVPAEKAEVLPKLKPKTAQFYDEFYRCRSCDQIYWKGPHFRDLAKTLTALGLTLERYRRGLRDSKSNRKTRRK